MRNPISALLLWLVVDSDTKLGRLAPWVFGLAIGRWPHRGGEEAEMKPDPDLFSPLEEDLPWEAAQRTRPARWARKWRFHRRREKEKRYNFIIETLNHSAYELRRPLVVKVEELDDGRVILTYKNVLYATGDDLRQAVGNLMYWLVDDYEWLRSKQPRLHGNLWRRYLRLRKIIRER